jgi:hypothetical protein
VARVREEAGREAAAREREEAARARREAAARLRAILSEAALKDAAAFRKGLGERQGRLGRISVQRSGANVFEVRCRGGGRGLQGGGGGRGGGGGGGGGGAGGPGQGSQHGRVLESVQSGSARHQQGTQRTRLSSPPRLAAITPRSPLHH